MHTPLVAARDHLREENLTLLLVEDFVSHGLVGDEYDRATSLCALVRDNLNRQKESSHTAGGVFGLGVKVSFCVFRISTVSTLQRSLVCSRRLFGSSVEQRDQALAGAPGGRRRRSARA